MRWRGACATREALAQREQAQLANIEAIKADYEKGLLDAGRAGTSAQQMKNWQRFVRNLDAVHTEQIERTRRPAGVRDEHRGCVARAVPARQRVRNPGERLNLDGGTGAPSNGARERRQHGRNRRRGRIRRRRATTGSDPAAAEKI